MRILLEAEVDEIKNANAEINAALYKRHALCTGLFTPGSVLYWRSRGYLQQGTVIYYTKFPSCTTIRAINNRTQKEVNVDLYFVDWDVMIRQAKIAAEMMQEVTG
jgi:hypothetical protein